MRLLCAIGHSPRMLSEVSDSGSRADCSLALESQLGKRAEEREPL
jgi:hypothetical protein